MFEPEVSFRVTKIKKKDFLCVVYGEIVDERPPVLKDAVSKFEQKPFVKKLESVCESGLKYADPFPNRLSDFLEIEKGYVPNGLEQAIKFAKFEGSEELINEANGKMEELKRILKDFDLTEDNIKSVFIYTVERKELRGKSPYNVVNKALSTRNEDLHPLKDYIFYLLQGLRNLPRFKKQKVLYRGVKMSHLVAKNIYREGRTLTWTSFSSTSTDESKAYYFASDDGVVFEIHGKFRGYSIGTFSSYGDEEGNTC